VVVRQCRQHRLRHGKAHVIAAEIDAHRRHNRQRALQLAIDAIDIAMNHWARERDLRAAHFQAELG